MFSGQDCAIHIHGVDGPCRSCERRKNHETIKQASTMNTFFHSKCCQQVQCVSQPGAITTWCCTEIQSTLVTKALLQTFCGDRKRQEWQSYCQYPIALLPHYQDMKWLHSIPSTSTITNSVCASVSPDVKLLNLKSICEAFHGPNMNSRWWKWHLKIQERYRVPWVKLPKTEDSPVGKEKQNLSPQWVKCEPCKNIKCNHCRFVGNTKISEAGKLLAVHFFDDFVQV